MKEVISLVLAMALSLCLLSGCAGPSQTAESSARAEASAEHSGADASQSAPDTSAPPQDSDLATAAPSPDWVQKLPQAEEAHQLFVVAAVDQNTAQVSMHQRDSAGAWRELLSGTGYIGKNGLGKTQEGDGKTPVGTFHFTRAFGIAADPGCGAFDYLQVTGDHYWSGDQREGMHYNEMVDLRELPELDISASEHIEDFWDQYQYCLNISWNEDGTPGKGSAIFLHCYGDKTYTGGCVALPEEQMVQVLRQVESDCVVVIDSLENLGGE